MKLGRSLPAATYYTLLLLLLLSLVSLKGALDQTELHRHLHVLNHGRVFRFRGDKIKRRKYFRSARTFGGWKGTTIAYGVHINQHFGSN